MIYRKLRSSGVYARGESTASPDSRDTRCTHPSPYEPFPPHKGWNTAIEQDMAVSMKKEARLVGEDESLNPLQVGPLRNWLSPGANGAASRTTSADASGRAEGGDIYPDRTLKVTPYM